MSIAQFNGRVVLSGTNLVETSTIPGSNLKWTVTFSFQDSSGKYLGTNVAVGDVVALDTGGTDLATVTSYRISNIVSSTFNSFRVELEYLSTNNNPSGAPDINSAVELPGIVSRLSTTARLATIPDAGIQLVPSSLITQLANDNLFNVVDSLVISSSANTPSTLVTRDASGNFAANTITTNTLTVQSLTFSGTGPVAITSSNDINLTAPGMITLGAVAQLVTKTKAQLTALNSVPAGTIAYCADTASGARPVYFNGTTWVKIADDGAI